MLKPNEPIKHIPFVDLVTPHIAMQEELTTIFHQVLGSGGFIGGALVEGFERDFATFSDTRHAVAVSSGTDALRFALVACGVKPGEVVVTVPHTFIATTEAITQAGAVPEFVDIDERTYNMSAECLNTYLAGCTRDRTGKLISRRSGRPVTAIVPVHLYGQMVDMDAICELATQYRLRVIEDACQAHGAEYFSQRQRKWVRAGSVGRAAAFSFYPAKNLGACGEGGAVTTNDPKVADRVRVLRDHGQTKKYYHSVEGYNGRLDALQAGILGIKLQSLAGWNKDRRHRADVYRSLLSPVDGVVLPVEPSWSRAIYHLYVVRLGDRERLRKHLSAANIGTGIHYPVPLHLQVAYRKLCYRRGDLPVSERVATEILSLPMHPHLSRREQEHVAEQVAQCMLLGRAGLAAARLQAKVISAASGAEASVGFGAV